MSDITTIKEVSSLEDKDLIKRMRVTVKSAFAPKTGENEWGQWKVQSCTLKDETGEIRASFYDYPRDIRQLQGNTIEIVSGRDGKDNPSGIHAMDYENRKNNTVTRQIKINPNATIDEVVGETKGGDGKANPGGGPAPTRVTQSYQPDEKGPSIEKQVVLKGVIDLLIPQVGLLDKDGKPLSMIGPETVVTYCNVIYNGFFAAKPVEAPKPVAKPEPKQEKPTPANTPEAAANAEEEPF